MMWINSQKKSRVVTIYLELQICFVVIKKQTKNKYINKEQLGKKAKQIQMVPIHSSIHNVGPVQL